MTYVSAALAVCATLAQDVKVSNALLTLSSLEFPNAHADFRGIHWHLLPGPDADDDAFVGAIRKHLSRVDRKGMGGADVEWGQPPIRFPTAADQPVSGRCVGPRASAGPSLVSVRVPVQR